MFLLPGNLCTNSVSNVVSSLNSGNQGWKYQLSNHKLGLSGNQPPSRSYLGLLSHPAISYLISITKTHVITPETWRVSEALVQELETKTKHINTTYGPMAFDQCIMSLSTIMVSCKRASPPMFHAPILPVIPQTSGSYFLLPLWFYFSHNVEWLESYSM